MTSSFLKQCSKQLQLFFIENVVAFFFNLCQELAEVRADSGHCGMRKPKSLTGNTDRLMPGDKMITAERVMTGARLMTG